MPASTFSINAGNFENLQKAMKNYKGNVEEVINNVLHMEASPLIQDKIRLLMPVSDREWKGKLPHAKTSKSLTDEKGNLSITVKTTKNYQYLYFPDDGSTTLHHAGNQQFFKRGGEMVQDEIIDRCIGALVNDFENMS